MTGIGGGGSGLGSGGVGGMKGFQKVKGGGWEGLDIYKILLAEEIFGGNLHDLHTRSN